MADTNHVDFNVDHLCALALVLEQLPVDCPVFSMNDFYSTRDPRARAHLRPDVFMSSAGAPIEPAYANPIGWGAFAGIRPLPSHFVLDPKTGQHFNWLEYSQYLIGGQVWWRHFSWLFDPGWTKIDDTARGAALRIQYLLKHRRPPKGFKDAAYTKRPILYAVK